MTTSKIIQINRRTLKANSAFFSVGIKKLNLGLLNKQERARIDQFLADRNHADAETLRAVRQLEDMARARLRVR